MSHAACDVHLCILDAVPQSVGVTGYIVGAMDDHLLRELISHKYNCFR